MKMKKLGNYLLLAILLAVAGQLFLTGCLEEEDPPDYLAEEKKLRDEWLAVNNITVEPTASGLYYIVEDSGTGPQPVFGDSVIINYVGYYLNGYVFATNIEEIAIERGIHDPGDDYTPFKFVLGSSADALKGVNEGITYMREGGSATLVIPSTLAIPESYLTMVYKIDLLKVIPGPF